MIPATAKVIEEALIRTAQHGGKGDLDKLIAYLKTHPSAVHEITGSARHAGGGKDEQKIGKIT